MNSQMILKSFVCVFFLMFLDCDKTWAESIHLVKDINPNAPDASEDQFRATEHCVAGNRLFFTNFDSVHGLELWVSDGTSAGTHIVKDIEPGILSSCPQSLIAVGNTIYFSALTHSGGRELWKTDGTAGGTILVKDINPGAAGSKPQGLVNLKGLLYFSADDGAHGAELWKSDGTAAGTVLVGDLNPGAASSVPMSLTAFHNMIYFSANDGTHGAELWCSDGTPAGTRQVKDLNPSGSSSINAFTAGSTTLFFCDNTSTSSPRLWSTDGTAAGTVVIKDFASTYAPLRELTFINGRLYFCQSSILWEYDGTDVKKIDQAYGAKGAGYISNLRVCGQSLYYYEEAAMVGNINRISPTDSIQHIWVTPGLVQPRIAALASIGDRTFIVAGSVLYGVDDDSSTPTVVQGFSVFSPSFMETAGSHIYLHGNQYPKDWGLWITDGSSGGTTRITSVYPGSANAFPSQSKLVESQGKLFFAANDGEHGSELWKSDGTDTGTGMVKDINPKTNGSSGSLTDVNGTLFFGANDGIHGTELWKSNGSESGTTLVKDINPGAADGMAIFEDTDHFGYQKNFYFRANNGTSGGELWKSDGTPQGTALFKDFTAGSGESFFYYLGEINGQAYLNASSGVPPYHVWRTDGTAKGTVTVPMIPSLGLYYYCFANKLYFQSQGGLWVSDGTTTGTTQLKSLDPDLSIFCYGNADKTLYFSTGSSQNEFSLWKSDGTSNGTTLVKKLYPGSFAYICNMVQANGRLFFKVLLNRDQFELWSSDGSAAGTSRIAGGLYYPAGEWRMSTELVPLGNQVFFTNTTPETGVELWASDGTLAGTRMVVDLAPGPGHACPNGLKVFNGRIFFTANDANIGNELWMYDPQDVRVLSPNGGETFRGGDTIQVLWNSNLRTAGSAVRLELWRGSTLAANLGNSWQPEGNGNLKIQLPNALSAGDYRLRAVSTYDSKYEDYSDRLIRIISRNGVSQSSWSDYQ